nr:hypothetical protein [Abalone asfa-like virus]
MEFLPEDAASPGFDHNNDFLSWYHKVKDHEFKNIFDLLHELKLELPERIVEIIPPDRPSYYLINHVCGKAKVLTDLKPFVFKIMKTEVPLTVILPFGKKIIPCYKKVVSSPTSGLILWGNTFNEFKSPIRAVPQKTGRDTSTLVYFVESILTNKNPALATKIYDFIRGILVNQPIGQALYVYSPISTEYFYALQGLFEKIIYPIRITNPGVFERNKDNYKQICEAITPNTCLLILNNPDPKIFKEDYFEIAIRSKPGSVITMSKTTIPTHTMNGAAEVLHNFIEISGTKSIDPNYWISFYQDINTLPILQQFTFDILAKPPGSMQLYPIKKPRSEIIEKEFIHEFLEKLPKGPVVSISLDYLFDLYQDHVVFTLPKKIFQKHIIALYGPLVRGYILAPFRV